MKLLTEAYLAQAERWPKAGRHILAQFNDETVVVYQAYRPAIGHFAAQHTGAALAEVGGKHDIVVMHVTGIYRGLIGAISWQIHGDRIICLRQFRE